MLLTETETHSIWKGKEEEEKGLERGRDRERDRERQRETEREIEGERLYMFEPVALYVFPF